MGMIKVLANKVLAFSQGEKDAKGNLIRVKTVVGFCELPDWVEKDEYFIAAKRDKSILAVGSSNESETVLKEMEKLEAIRAEIAAMEEKRDLLAKAEVPSDSEDGTPGLLVKPGPDAKPDSDAKPDKNTTK